MVKFKCSNTNYKNFPYKINNKYMNTIFYCYSVNNKSSLKDLGKMQLNMNINFWNTNHLKNKAYGG